MGEFKVTVIAVGNHGCQRDKGDGDTVIGCDQFGCTDCITREYVRRLKRAGAIVSKAELHHWPSSLRNVRDDLLTGERRGTFPEYDQLMKGVR